MDFGQFKDSVSQNSDSVGQVDFEFDIKWIERTTFCDSYHFRLDLSFHNRQWGIITNRICLSKNDSMNLWVIYFWELQKHQIEIVQIWASVFIKKNSFQCFLQTENINNIWAELDKVIEILPDRNLNDGFSDLRTDWFEDELICLLNWWDVKSRHVQDIGGCGYLSSIGCRGLNVNCLGGWLNWLLYWCLDLLLSRNLRSLLNGNRYIWLVDLNLLLLWLFDKHFDLSIGNNIINLVITS